MNLFINRKTGKLLAVLLICLGLSGCIGTVIGAVVDTTIEIVKVPFKIGGAVVDVMTSDELSDEGRSSDHAADADADDAELRMESATL